MRYRYLITAAVLLAAGAWLRWSTGPVRVAYQAGRVAQRIKAGRS
jgi:hypothetical protein